jgi:2,3-bisphosphoglycerate-dependent phosphoglycerate mutase
VVKLVLLRHGESIANQKNTYTGWSDVGLTAEGKAQAETAGEKIASTGILFDHVHTSVLSRAIMTAYIVQDKIGQNYLPITKSWRLNERHYGALRGINKDLTRKLFGPDQVASWRRSFSAHPPLLANPSRTRRYHRYPATIIPRGESLADASQRLLPYWTAEVAPRLLSGKNQLIVAHGSTLRALVKFMEDISDAGINKVEIGNAQPIVYTLDDKLTILDKQTL